jgi:hypothetical protein
MNCNYIKNPSLNKIGILCDDTNFRLKQGLPSQKLSNLCNSSRCCNFNCNGCDNTCQYPAYQPDVHYCLPPIPKNCPCLKYLYIY